MDKKAEEDREKDSLTSPKMFDRPRTVARWCISYTASQRGYHLD